LALGHPAAPPHAQHSPQTVRAVLVEDAIVADDRKILELRLGDEHSIERVAMCAGQTARALSVQDRNLERREALTGDAPTHARRNVERTRKFAEPRLRRNLPSRRGTDEDDIVLVGDERTRRS
jgi:hypothetical protein